MSDALTTPPCQQTRATPLSDWFGAGFFSRAVFLFGKKKCPRNTRENRATPPAYLETPKGLGLS